jgi:hypothetical protein
MLSGRQNATTSGSGKNLVSVSHFSISLLWKNKGLFIGRLRGKRPRLTNISWISDNLKTLGVFHGGSLIPCISGVFRNAQAIDSAWIMYKIGAAWLIRYIYNWNLQFLQPIKEAKICMFADDTQLLIKNEESVEQSFLILSKFEKAIGSKIK